MAVAADSHRMTNNTRWHDHCTLFKCYKNSIKFL